MKRKRKKKYKRLFPFLLLQLILLLVIYFGGSQLYRMAENQGRSNDSSDDKPSSKDDEEYTSDAISDDDGLDIAEVPSKSAEADGENQIDTETFTQPDNFTDAEYDAISVDTRKLVSQNAILVSLEDHKILFNKNSKDTIYPASLTKIMTAIIAIEKLKDSEQPVTLPADMFDSLYEEGASMAGFSPDETVPAIDLLYGVLLPSGAECCIGLADFIAGSEASFVKLMNEKAEALGMKNTHFMNSTGLHDPDHYTTVEDLSILLNYALKNDTFRSIFTASRHSTEPTSKHPDGITFYSTMFENMPSPDFNGGSILGGKTGYTSNAGLCLASLAEKYGKEYILITAGADGNHDTEQFNITDALFVYNSLE
jgi:serine-type D-Ala-D-Ala carboxypeptidase (penicillin-binding protein 5/6)